MSSVPKSEALRAVYWHSEILRVMYWLRGEGLGDLVDVAMVGCYVDIAAGECQTRLSELESGGWVVRDGDWFALSTHGLAEGEAEYATVFADLARPAHGSCSDECWCGISSAEELACGAQRAPSTLPRGPGR